MDKKEHVIELTDKLASMDLSNKEELDKTFNEFVDFIVENFDFSIEEEVSFAYGEMSKVLKNRKIQMKVIENDACLKFLTHNMEALRDYADKFHELYKSSKS